MFLFCLPSSGQFPSTFVEEVTIPSTKPGDRLYVCINDYSSAEPGNLSLKRGTDTLNALIQTFYQSWLKYESLLVFMSLGLKYGDFYQHIHWLPYVLFVSRCFEQDTVTQAELWFWDVLPLTLLIFSLSLTCWCRCAQVKIVLCCSVAVLCWMLCPDVLSPLPQTGKLNVDRNENQTMFLVQRSILYTNK